MWESFRRQVQEAMELRKEKSRTTTGEWSDQGVSKITEEMQRGKDVADVKTWSIHEYVKWTMK